jgi:outer membrane protein
MTTQNNNADLHPYKSTLKSFVRILIPAILLTLLLGMAAKAQDRTITLDEAIKLGLDNSKVLKLSQNKINRAVSQFNQAKDQALPTASASFDYNLIITKKC